MMAEVKQAKRYLGARFGMGETIPTGSYAVPTQKYDRLKNEYRMAFMAVLVTTGGGMSGFGLFWDEQLQHPCDKPRPARLKQSRFAMAFRMLEEERGSL